MSPPRIYFHFPRSSCHYLCGHCIASLLRLERGCHGGDHFQVTNAPVLGKFLDPTGGDLSKLVDRKPSLGALWGLIHLDHWMMGSNFPKAVTVYDGEYQLYSSIDEGNRHPQ